MVKPISLNVKCRSCGKSIMDYKKKLHDFPSIACDIEIGGKKGKLWLCSIYGCYDHESTVDMKKGELVTFTCPHCHDELNSDIICKLCDGRMVKFDIAIGGIVSICSRVGCTNHYVMFEDLADALRKYHSEYDA